MKLRFLGIILLLSLCLSAQEEERRDALKLYQERNFQEAVEVCLQELEEYGDDQNRKRMDAYTVLCWSYMGLRQYDNVIRYGQEALGYYRYDNRIIHSLGEAYYRKGDLDQALDYFEEYTLLNPTGGGIRTAYYFIGEIYLRKGQYAHADIAFSTALYHSPNVAGWWVRLGYAREQAEDWDYAREAYQKALELQPGLADATAGLERMEGQR